ncbi:MAG: hypothetical protein IH587_11175 [Anaerolineae bacterium]|nr:hypothetical protein [Anaerolineae bacterium]
MVLSPRVVTVGFLFVLLGGATLASQTYFSWAERADLFYETDADLSAAARWMQTQPVDNTRVYLAARDRIHPTVLIEQTPPITWLGTDTLFRAPDGIDGLYVFPRSAPPPEDWVAWLESGRIDDLPLGPDGRTAFEAFRLPGSIPLPPASRDLPGDSQNAWMSLAAFYPVAIESGGGGEIVTAWQIERAPDVADLTPLVQIETAEGVVLSRGDIYMTDTDRWEPGAVLFIRVPISIPVGTPPGSYSVRIAWVARASDTYAPYLKDTGGQAGIWAMVGQVQVLRPAQSANPDLLPIANRLDMDVAPGVRLLGFSPPAATVRPGESVTLAFYWQAVPTSEPRPSVTVHPVLRGAGRDYYLDDNGVLDTIYAPPRWTDGDILADYLRWEIERDQPAGDYQLYAVIENHEVLIGTLRIEGVARLYDMPPFDVEVGAEFEGVIRLAGYSVDTTDGLKLRLVWQAVAVMEQDYSVFVHLLDDRKNIVAQQDAMPVNNTYPTSLWQAGEFIVDEYQFPELDADGLSIELGWYLQSTGERLDVTSPSTLETRDTLDLLF